MKTKFHIPFLLLGLVLGGVTTAASGLLYYKAVKKSRQLTRCNAQTPYEQKNGKPADGFEVFAASSLDRIFQDGKTLLPPHFSEAVEISSAKREHESFQVVVKNNESSPLDVTLQLSDLIDPATGAKIENKNFSWRQVGYVPTKEPYYPVKYVGLWPDPLMPVEKGYVDSKKTQPFWITLYIPSTTPAGEYQGTVEVFRQGNAGEKIPLQNIPLKVSIYDFVLSKETHLKTAFDFYGHITKDRYFQGEKEPTEVYQSRISELNEKFILEMLRFRMNPILNIDPTSPTSLGNVDRYRAYGLNNFAIGRKGGTFNNNWPEDEEGIEKLLALYRTYGEMLKLNKMLPYTYIYTWDEGPMGNPRTAKVASMIHRAYPELKNMVCYHGLFDPNQDPNWIKDIDIWTFQIDDFNPVNMEKLKKAGKEMWMYISGPGGTGSPNLAIDFDSIDYRIAPWMCWKYGIKGFLYWSVNWWTLADPFKTAVNTEWEQNGNGLLFYPGPDGPIDSLRAELWRDGAEDYEYLFILQEKLAAIKEKGLAETNAAVVEEAQKLLTVEPELIESFYKFNKDETMLRARRDRIAQAIQKLDALLPKPAAEPVGMAPVRAGQQP